MLISIFFPQKKKGKKKVKIASQLPDILYSLINLVVVRLNRLFNFIWGEMQLIFSVLNFSLLTITPKLWDALLPKKNSCLYVVCLVGCLLAQGLDCLEIIYVLYVRNLRKRRRVKFIRSQLYVRCSTWALHNIIFIISRMLWSWYHYSHFINKGNGTKDLKGRVKIKTEDYLIQKPIGSKLSLSLDKERKTGKKDTI